MGTKRGRAHRGIAFFAKRGGVLRAHRFLHSAPSRNPAPVFFFLRFRARRGGFRSFVFRAIWAWGWNFRGRVCGWGAGGAREAGASQSGKRNGETFLPVPAPFSADKAAFVIGRPLWRGSFGARRKDRGQDAKVGAAGERCVSARGPGNPQKPPKTLARKRGALFLFLARASRCLFWGGPQTTSASGNWRNPGGNGAVANRHPPPFFRRSRAVENAKKPQNEPWRRLNFPPLDF